jgi:hypothetical protein
LEVAAALGFIALVFTWLLKRLVVRIAGESEPLYFHSYWGSALPLRGHLRIAFAVAVGVCAGAVVRSIFDTAVFSRSASRPANQEFFGGAKSSANRTRKVACAANII